MSKLFFIKDVRLDPPVSAVFYYCYVVLFVCFCLLNMEFYQCCHVGLAQPPPVLPRPFKRREEGGAEARQPT